MLPYYILFLHLRWLYKGKQLVLHVRWCCLGTSFFPYFPLDSTRSLNWHSLFLFLENKYFIFILYVCVFCIWVLGRCRCLQMAEGSVRLPGARVTCVSLLVWVLELNSGPLQDQNLLLTAEPPSRSWVHYLVTICVCF